MFSKEKQSAVFQRFEKLDDYKSGAGLGLSICTLIADRLGGTLSIDPPTRTGPVSSLLILTKYLPQLIVKEQQEQR